MASDQRDPEGTIHHSDQGSQYAAVAFGQRCEDAGVRPSMGPAGDCYDNALCESFFAPLERELTERKSYATRPEARLSPEGLRDTSRGGTIRTDCTQPLTISRR